MKQKRQHDKYTKFKTVDVAATAWFGPSPMDKAMEKYINEGWTLEEKEQLGKNKYRLTFMHQMTPEQIAEQKKKERNSGIGCLVIIAFIVIASMGRGNSSSSAQQTQTAASARQSISQIQPTNTQTTNNAQSASNISQSKTPNPVSIVDDEYDRTLVVERIEYRKTIGSRNASEDFFYILFAKIINTGESRTCVYARDIRLVLDDEEYAPDDGDMGAYQAIMRTSRDYVGPVSGHCVEPDQTIETFAVFDVPFGDPSVSLEFNDVRKPMGVRLVTDIETGQYMSADFPTSDDVAIAAAATPTSRPRNSIFLTQTAEAAEENAVVEPTATFQITATREPSATRTVAPSRTPRPTLTRTIAPSQTLKPASTRTPAPTRTTAQTYYAIRNANLRSCAKANDSQCPTITGVGINDEVSVIGTEQGDIVSGSPTWYMVLHGDRTLYVHSSLLSKTQVQVQVQPVQPTTVQEGGQSTPLPMISTPTVVINQWNCSGNLYNCGDFHDRGTLMSYWNACPGDPSDLDGNDNDGVPCESLR